MSNHWVPREVNKRNHGNRQIGYVPVGGNYTQKNNIVKFYTRVVLKNGKWIADPASKFGNYVRPANGKNFLKVASLRSLNNFIRVANLYGGHVPIKTTHKWSNVNKERNTKNRGVPRNMWVGYPGHLNFPIN
jgi:hypothetical protein